MNKNKTIVIADDHSIVRKGLRQVIESEPAYSVLEAANGTEALQMIREHRPMVAVLDIEMPGMTGFDIVERMNAEQMPTAVILLTMYNDEHVFNRAMDAGVKGYILKENTITEILQGIKAVSEGKYYYCPMVTEYIIKRNTKLVGAASDHTGINLLTPSERKVLKLLSAMKTNQQIAGELKISIKTVHNHRNNICDKLGLHGAHALMKFAIDHSQLL